MDSQDKPDAAQIKVLAERGAQPQNVSTGNDWYAWLRDNQNSWVKPLSTGFATEEARFLQDSLFCEWGYALDLDNWQVLIFEGFNKDKDKQHPLCATEKSRSGYYGCSLLWSGSVVEFNALDMEKLEQDTAE